MTKYSTVVSDLIIYTFTWPTRTTTTSGAPSTYSKFVNQAQIYIDLYRSDGTSVFVDTPLSSLPAGFVVYLLGSNGFNILVPASAVAAGNRFVMVCRVSPAVPTANQYPDQFQYAEINDSYNQIYLQALYANTAVQAGGYTGSRVNAINAQIVTGGAGTVADNAATAATAATAGALDAAIAATQATNAATTSAILNAHVGTPTPPATLSQIIELAYAVTNNAKRFDAATGRMYLRNAANDGDLGYWPCFQDYAGLVPATDYNNIVYQGRFQS